MTDVILKEAKRSLNFWRLYYHLLFWLHMLLGVLGVIIGALIAADLQFSFFDTKKLGICSTVIVGIVSFVQPGRLATIFYDAYWRLRVAILDSVNSETGDRDLISAISDGYNTIAKAQPQTLSETRLQEASRIDPRTLSPERQETLKKAYEQLLAEEVAEKETQNADKEKSDAGT